MIERRRSLVILGINVDADLAQSNNEVEEDIPAREMQGRAAFGVYAKDCLGVDTVQDVEDSETRGIAFEVRRD